ncbi:MAG: hypothetical protein JWM44_1524 [Bacilli bacterium]|nr:hypothetical protein [Bacilli bacterium]
MEKQAENSEILSISQRDGQKFSNILDASCDNKEVKGASLVAPLLYCAKLTEPYNRFKASRCTAIVSSISSSECAAETNIPSNCEGATQTPKSSKLAK